MSAFDPLRPFATLLNRLLITSSLMAEPSVIDPSTRVDHGGLLYLDRHDGPGIYIDIYV